MEIPIENIYFLLCYAWDRLAERDVVKVNPIDSKNLLDLFGRVLVSGTNHLIRRGFDRGYVSHREWTPRIRGRVMFRDVVRRGRTSAELPCEFDDLSYDVLHNQIIKATAQRLCDDASIAGATAESLFLLVRRLDQVSRIELNSRLFRQVQLHRNNHFYDFLLKVCELIYQNCLITEEEGDSKFLGFERDEGQMRQLFQNFVLNFYIKHASGYQAKPEQFPWKWKPLDEVSEDVLPRMMTDVSLTSQSRKIIIECKYVPKALNKGHWSTQEKLIRDHLFQLFAYVKNQANDVFRESCEGLLLYPTVGSPVSASYSDGRHRIRVRTIDLKQKWQGIHNDLLGLVH